VQLRNSALNATGFISLATTTQTQMDAFEVPYPPIPGTVGISDMVVTSTYVYVLHSTSTSFVGKMSRFDITNNTWVSYSDLPATVGSTVFLVIDSDYLYVLRGTSTDVYRHSITNTSAGWQSFTALPGATGTGTGLAIDSQYLYVLRGGSTAFYRHTLANTSTSWDSFTVLPASVSTGGQLLADSNYVYVFTGNATTSYRHTTSATSTAWEPFALLPKIVTTGSTATIDANYLYIILGTTTGFSTTTYRHELSSTSTPWDFFAQSTLGLQTGGAIAVDANYLYMLRGNNSQFYRHTLADTSTSWESYSSIPSTVAAGSALAVDGSYIHVMQGNTNSALYRHVLTDTSSVWIGGLDNFYISRLPQNSVGFFGADEHYMYSSGSTTRFYRREISSTSSPWEEIAAITSGGSQVVISGNGSATLVDENYIYYLAGQRADAFYRHTKSNTSSAWDPYLTLPTTSGQYGVPAIRNGYLYFLQGNSGAAKSVYRRDVANTSSAWDVFADLPASMGIAASMVFDQDYVYVLRGGNTSSTYRHTLANTSTPWETFTNTPANIFTLSGSKYMDIDENYLYVLRNAGTALYRHTLANTSSAWDTFATLPGTVSSYGFVTVFDGYAYVYQGTGGGNTGFWRHPLSETSSAWQVLPQVPQISTSYVSFVPDVDRGAFHFSVNTASGTTFIKYELDRKTFQSSGNFTSAPFSFDGTRPYSFSWSSSTPMSIGGSSLRLQIATSTDNVSYSSFFGTDGTVSTYFTAASTTLTEALTTGAKYVKYKAFFSTSDTSKSPQLKDITFNFVSYASSGTLISSVYDSSDSSSILDSLEWSATTSTSTTVRFQIRTGGTTTSLSSADWVGPDNTSSTYFSTSGSETLNSAFTDGVGEQFVQYKAYLTSSSGVTSPVLSNVTLSFVPPSATTVATPSYGGSSPPLVGYYGLEVFVPTATTTVQVTAPATSTSPVTPTIAKLTVPLTSSVQILPTLALKQALGTARLTKVLQMGMSDSQVRLLQRALNALGFTIAKSGAGSPGKETNYFGPATRLALIRFQEANAKSILTPLGLTKGTGKFAAGTRAFIAELLKR
jgi:N-acetylneuraminic acid mutarotase